MGRYIITYERQRIEQAAEEIECDSLAAAYKHAHDNIARQIEDPKCLDDLDWVHEIDLTAEAYAVSILCPAGISHVFHEIPEDIQAAAELGTAQETTTEIDDNTWEGVVDAAEELGQRDKDLFGPVV